MGFSELPERPETYVDLDGSQYNLQDLPVEAREDLAALIQYYNWNPPYPQFKTYWRDDASPVGVYLASDHPLNRLMRTIGRDLEKRLGLAQGRLAT